MSTLVCPLSADLCGWHQQASLLPGPWLGNISGDRGRRSLAGVWVAMASSWSCDLGFTVPLLKDSAPVTCPSWPLLSSHWFCDCSLPSPSGLRTLHPCWPGVLHNPFSVSLKFAHTFVNSPLLNSPQVTQFVCGICLKESVTTRCFNH